MKLNAPKKKVFLISVAVIAVAVVLFIVSFFAAPTALLIAAFCVALAGAVLLALGNILKGF